MNLNWVWLAGFACCACGGPVASLPTVDLLISGGEIIDGSGRESTSGNVEITGSKIIYVGIPRAVTARRSIDATGFIVSPGFIDPHTHAEGDLTSPETSKNEAYLRQGVTTVFVGNDGGGKTVTSMRNQLETMTIGTNVGLWSGHGALRQSVMGFANRPPSAEELDKLKQLLAADMEAGALGLSTGLFYAPGSFAETAELVALAEVAGRYGGIYESHIRDESNYNIGLLAALDELIHISAQADIPAHVSHIKALGPAVHGQSEQLVQRIEQARQQGLVITADQYPWLASGTRLSNALIPRSLMAGGVDKMQKRLVDDTYMNAVWPQMQANLIRRGGADAMLITGDSRYRGKTLQQLAKEHDSDVLPMAIKIILSGDPAIASFMMHAGDLNRLIVQPWVVTGSDGTVGHPRKYGSFPKKYEAYVVDTKLLSIEQFVRQSSARTAQIFGLCDRGQLKAGLNADIVVWSTDEFSSKATYENPTELAEGVQFLIINGKVVIDDAVLADTKAGEVIDGRKCTR